MSLILKFLYSKLKNLTFSIFYSRLAIISYNVDSDVIVVIVARDIVIFPIKIISEVYYLDKNLVLVNSF